MHMCSAGSKNLSWNPTPKQQITLCMNCMGPDNGDTDDDDDDDDDGNRGRDDKHDDR